MQRIQTLLFFFLFISIIGCDVLANDQTIIALNEPAVVPILVDYKANFRCPYPEFAFIDGQFIFKNQIDIFEDEITNSWAGTGFIITSDGYAITNAHIADPEQFKLFGYLFDHALEITDLFLDEGTIDLYQYDLFLSSYYEYLIENGNFSSEQRSIKAIFGDRIESAELIISGDPIGIRTSKDVALIKIETSGMYPLSTVNLGDSDQVEVGNEIIALGYSMMAEGKESSLLISSRGTILDFRQFGDWKALQTDVDITFGYSGGPVLNLKNEVIGISTFGMISPINQTETKFLVPIKIAIEYLMKAAIQNERSELDEYYEKGTVYFLDQNYYDSINQFSKVLELNPEHIYAKYYLELAQMKMYPENFTLEVYVDGLPVETYTNIYIDEFLSGNVSTQRPNLFSMNNEKKSYNITLDEYVMGSQEIRFHCENYSQSFWGLSNGEELTFVYEPQYYFRIISKYGNPQGEDWYDRGEIVYAIMPGISNTQGEYEIEYEDVRADFNGWSGNASGSSEKSEKIIMDGPKTVVAEWEEEYTLEIISEFGEIRPYIGKEWHQTVYFPNRSKVVDIEIIQSSYFDVRTFEYRTFIKWEGDASGSSPDISIHMDSSKKVIAIWRTEDFFSHNRYSLIVMTIGFLIVCFAVLRKFMRSKRIL